MTFHNTIQSKFPRIIWLFTQTRYTTNLVKIEQVCRYISLNITFHEDCDAYKDDTRKATLQ